MENEKNRYDKNKTFQIKIIVEIIVVTIFLGQYKEY